MVIRSWVKAKETAFSVPLKKNGKGSPAICPMETYIRGRSRAIDHKSLCFVL